MGFERRPRKGWGRKTRTTVNNDEWLENHGREHGLTRRESQVISLITQGLSNAEIAATTFLSINSVKTYIRSTYRKIGVARRAQAVVWGMRNGFVPPQAPPEEPTEDLHRAAREAADAMGLPLTVVDTGLSGLEAELARLVA